MTKAGFREGTMACKKVAVFGAGAMGAGIALISRR